MTTRPSRIGWSPTSWGSPEAAGLRSQGRRERARRLRATAVALVFLAPALVLLALFEIGPVFYSLYVSLLKWNIIGRPLWVGLDNYRTLLGDEGFRNAAFNTAYYVVLSVPTTMGLALVLAWGLNRHLVGLGALRTAYFLPYVTAANAAAIVWYYVFHPGAGGLLNEAIRALGLPRQRWLLDPMWAMPAVALTQVWHLVGYQAVLFLAGLQNISREYYEAAFIDGATGWKLFRTITWPLLSPTTYFVLIISLIGAFQVFSPVYVMTRGGPVDSTVVLVYYLYRQSFEYFDFGYASAMAYVLFAFLFALTLMQRRIIGTRVHYQ